MSVKKSMRFEVFKRDKFTCQYCGKKAPDVILHLDHITPISKGGDDDILNLVTACVDCNLGKGARELDDDTAIQKRREQLEELEERREQLEMLLEWHRSLAGFDQQVINNLAVFWSDLTPGYSLNDSGLQLLKKWVSRFSVDEVLEAMRICAKQYLQLDEDGKFIQQSVNKAFDYIPRVCNGQRKRKDKPYLPQLYYIRGILRNRLHYVNEWKSIQIMEKVVLAGAHTDDIKEVALVTTNWTEFQMEMAEMLKELQEEQDEDGQETL